MFFRVLSHLVCLPGPNWSSAPAVFISVYLGPNRGSFATSSQQLFIPLLSNDGSGEGVKMYNIALCTFIYLHFWTVRFVYLVHNDTYFCFTNVLQML